MAVACVLGGVAAVMPAAPAAVAGTVSAAAYNQLGSVRVLDTRNGTGGSTGPVGAGKSIRLQVAGVSGVPASGVTAVVLNVTAIKPTAGGFVTVYPDGQARPVASNLASPPSRRSRTW